MNEREDLDRLKAMAWEGLTKPGKRTSEFWLALLAGAVGALLIVVGGALVVSGNPRGDALVTMGGTVVSFATGAYSVSRGMAKKGKP